MIKSTLRKISIITAACVAGFLVSETAAATASLSAVPTAWRIQSYSTSNLVLWYTGSGCSNGKLTLDPSDTLDRSKELLATILTAKASALPVIIEYDIGDGDICYIRSFGIDTQ